MLRWALLKNTVLDTKNDEFGSDLYKKKGSSLDEILLARSDWIRLKMNRKRI